MKIFIKSISLILVAFMLSSLLLSCTDATTSEVPVGGDGKYTLPTRTITDETLYTEGVFQYALYDDGTAILVEHTGDETEIVIPDMLGGYKVTAIAADAFYGNLVATSVTIGKYVEIIGAGSFNGCIKLEKVEIPESVCTIYPNAFVDTPWYNSLTDEFVIVGDSVLLKYNGDDTSVVIPDGVKHMSAVFYGNETIIDVTIPDSVYTIGAAAFSSSTLRRASLGNNVVFIDDSAFAYCYDLHYINMPESLKVIESYAFMSCTGLNYLKIGKNVEEIRDYAFYRCSQFSYFYLPKSVKVIGNYAFEDCNYLTHVYYEGSEENFAALGVDGKNSRLSDAKKFYNYDYEGGTYEAKQ